MRYLMIDIGGTNIKYGLTTDKKTIIQKNKMPTEPFNGFDSVLAKVENIIKQFEPVDLVAISQAGIIREDSSILFCNPKMKGFTGRSFKTELEKKFKIPVYVINDAKSGASFVAKNIPEKNALLVVLGTGVGSAMIIGGNLFMAPLGITGEIGLAIVEGKPIDDHLSLARLKQRIVDSGKDIDFGDYEKLGMSEEIFKNYVSTLATWTFNMFMIYGIPDIYFGGSLPAFGDKILKDLKKEIIAIDKTLGEYINLSFSPEGENANMLGALYVALERHNK